MKTILLLTVLLATYSTQSAKAAVVEYGLDDRDEWFTDVGGPQNVSTIDFTGYADGTRLSDQWAHLGAHFSGDIFASGEDNIAYPNNGWGSEGYPEINVAFDRPINWIAVDLPGYTRVHLYSDDALIYTSSLWGFGGPGHFGGLVSDVPFDRARFFETGKHVEFLDDLHFGPAIAVPAPACVVAFAIPFFLRRRKRRVAWYRDSGTTR